MLNRRRHVELAAGEIDPPVGLLMADAEKREVIRRLLLRRPVELCPSVNDLTGVPLTGSSGRRSPAALARRHRIEVFNAIGTLPYKPVVTSIL